MPLRPPRTCTTPRCARLAWPPHSKCDECLGAARRASDQLRGNSNQRGYGTEHRDRFRAAVLARDPWCTDCGRAQSTVADHYPLSRRDLVARGWDPDDPAHGRGLCHPCHSRWTAHAQPGGFRVGGQQSPDPHARRPPG